MTLVTLDGVTRDCAARYGFGVLLSDAVCRLDVLESLLAVWRA